MAQQDWFEKDFYAILGVPKDADQAAIKKAYRRLARKHHPDQNAGDATAEQRFKDIGEAHAVLADPKQREEYDAIRQMARGGARFTAGGPGGGGGFEDLFGAFGGGGWPAGAVQHRRRPGLRRSGPRGGRGRHQRPAGPDVRGRRGPRRWRLRRASRPARRPGRPGPDHAVASATPSRARPSP